MAQPPVNANASRGIGTAIRRVLEWVVGMATIHPSMHRLKNAVGLTAGLVVGRYVMDRAVGETPDGHKLEREDVPAPLKPIYGKLAYNHQYADNDLKSRYMHVLDLWTPAALGAVGAFAGSHDYAYTDGPVASAVKTAMKSPKLLTIDKAEYAAISSHGVMWRYLSGITSAFGSSSNIQLIPGPWNYGTTLSVSFQGTVPRNKLYTPYLPFVQKFFNSNNYATAYGASSTLPILQSELVGSPERNIPRFRKLATEIIGPWFGQRVTEEKVTAFLKPMLEARDKVFVPGGVPKEARAELAKELSGYLSGVGLEKHLMSIGLDPSTAMIGRNGFAEYLARSMGGEKAIQKIEDAYKRGLVERGVVKSVSSDAVNAATRAADKQVLAIGSLALGGLALSTVYLAHRALVADKERHEAYVDADSPEKGEVSKTRNRPMLRAVERVGEALNAPTSLSMHRTACALGLTIGGYIGMQVSNTLAGLKLSGEPLPREKIPHLVEKLYGKLSYNPASQLPADRWKYIAHWGIPAIFAVSGVIVASDLFFRNRRKQIDSSGEFLEEVENRATMAQANAWTPAMSLTALMVTPAGFGFLPVPFPNYGAALGTRFILGAGRKGVAPGLGELWTGSTSPYAEGPVLLRDRMIKYALGNPDLHPDQFEPMANGIVRQWFPDATPQQIHAFVRKMEKDREQFFVEGIGIPEEARDACEDVLEAHFKRGGLEKTLREIGLDPLNAALGSNGLSATIAKKFGAEKDLQDIKEEYAMKYTDRLRREQQAAAERPAQLGA